MCFGSNTVAEMNRDIDATYGHVVGVGHSQPVWLSNLGEVLAGYMPAFIRVFTALRDCPDQPSAEQFCAKGHEILGDGWCEEEAEDIEPI
jgi:hypothetical protein